MCADLQQYTSLFDQYWIEKHPNYSFEWERMNNPITIDPSHFICEGKLHGFSENLESADHCILTLNKLILCNVSRKSESIEKLLRQGETNYYLKLHNPTLRKFMQEERYGLRLVANNTIQDFICDTKEERQKWFDCLKAVSILERIEEHYQLREVIGSGSSATVRIGKRIGTDEEYAVKSIPKSNYIKKKHSLVNLLLM